MRRSTSARVKGRAVDGNIDIGEEIRHGADMVLMAVGEDEGANLLLVFLEKGEVGHDEIDAQEFGVREHHPGVDHNDVVAEADGGHVHAEFAQTA